MFQRIEAEYPGLYRLARALGVIVSHFVITIAGLLSLWGGGEIASLLRPDGKAIPLIGVSLDGWMFFLEVAAVTSINVMGVYKALLAYGRDREIRGR